MGTFNLGIRAGQWKENYGWSWRMLEYLDGECIYNLPCFGLVNSGKIFDEYFSSSALLPPRGFLTPQTHIGEQSTTSNIFVADVD